MTKVLTVRIPPALLARAEAKAASLGLDRAKYVRSLIEDDLAARPGAGGRQFVSEDLVGIYAAAEPAPSATNARVREVLRHRAGKKP
jgi:hypothetical protein